MSTHPTLNHVAISMDPAVLDDDGRRDVLAFYGEVFGWTEGDNTGEEGNPLILYTGAFGQFVYLLPADTAAHRAPARPLRPADAEPSRSSTPIVGRAQRYAAHDDRVQIIDAHARTTHGPAHDYVLTSAYIGFLLPLMVELQHLERVTPS